MSRILLIGCAMLASGVYAQSSGRLAGRVLADHNGKPLGGVTVVAARRIAPAPPVILRMVTDAQGRYSIDAASAGSYSVCIHAGTAYLNPCEWGSPVTVSTSDPAQEIRLRLGVRVVVKADDSSGHSASRDPNPPGSVLAVTLADGSGIEHPVPLTSEGAGIYEYSYLAPAQTALRLKVSSSHFLLADSSGSPIDERGHVFPVTTPSLAARSSALQNIRLPFTPPRFGPPPVAVPVRIRGKKGR